MKAYIYDTETTGLTPNRTLKLSRQPHIIEFFGHLVDLKNGKRSKPLHHLIRPPEKRLITEEISKITTITWDDVKDKPVMAEVFPEIKKALESAPVIIAHNMTFDRDMVEIEAERLDVKMDWPERLICSVEQTEHIKGYRFSLSALHEFLFGKKFDGAHRANVDVDALTKCCVELFKRGAL